MTDAAPRSFSSASSCRPSAVLYVEAHPADVALMEDYLGGLDDVTLSVAASIEHAIESARRAAPSIVLLVSARSGSREGSRGSSSSARSPGTAHPRARALARHLGFHRFVTKPIDLSLLGAAMSSVVPSAAG